MTHSQRVDLFHAEIKLLKRRLEILQQQLNRMMDARDAERILRDRTEEERDMILAAARKLRETLEWTHAGSICADPASAKNPDCPMCKLLRETASIVAEKGTKS